MKESRKKQAMEYLLNRLDEIDSKYDSLRDKSSQWRKATNKVKRDLRGEDKQGNLAISLNTYHNYLSDLRDAVKRTGRKHPALSSLVARKGYLEWVIRKLPVYESDLRSIAEMPPTTIHKGVTDLKNKIKKELNGTPRNEAVSILKKLLIHHPVVAMLEKEEAEKEDRSQERTESLEHKTINKKIYNGHALIETAKRLLNDESYTSRAWALALLTGRRSAEIIYHANFEYISDNTVLFSGQIKKSAGTADKPYPIPVLADSQTIIDALKAFRAMPEVAIFKTGRGSFDWHDDVKYSDLPVRDLNKAINQRTNGVLNSRAKSIVGDSAEVFKNTRIIYAEYCKQHMRNLTPEWSNMADDAFLRSILGHDQLGEVKHYNQAEVRNEANETWLKIPEKQEDGGDEQAQDKAQAKKNWRATKGLKEMREALEALNGEPVVLKVGKSERKVKAATLIRWHDDQLRFWCAENPTLKITQSAIEKNKGNTLDSGTGSVNVSVNRYTFKAWLQVVGADAVAEYNEGRD